MEKDGKHSSDYAALIGATRAYSFDKEILKTTPEVKSSGYQIFRKEGTMTGKTVTDPVTGVRTQQYKEGVFEIGVRKDGVIDHRFFRPNE